jgi:ribosomal protein S18 acetylase RimI-like enzyme
MEIFATLDEASFPRQVMEESAEAYTVENLKKRAFGRRSFAVGAFENGALVGFAWGWAGKERVFTLDWIGVQESHRRRGTGAAMLTLVEEYARRNKLYKISLFASAYATREVLLYIRRGYSIEGIHENHYYGWDFVSLGKVLTRPAWRVRTMSVRRPDRPLL